MQLFQAVFDTPGDARARTALVSGNEAYTYGRLRRAIESLAERITRLGVSKQSKVVVSLSTSASYLTAFFAVSRAKGVIIPLNPHLTEHERDQIFEVARPDFVISQNGAHDIMPGVRLSRCDGPANSEDPDLAGVDAIIFTSGTTGLPKGVMLSADNLLSNASSVVDYLALGHDDTTLVFLPLYYSYAMSQCLSTMLAGGTIILMPTLRYPAIAFKLIERNGVTGFGGVPSSLSLLVNSSAAGRLKLDTLRYVLNAGGPISPALVKKTESVFPQAHVFNNYGCTEIGPRATYIDCKKFPERVGSIGKAVSGVSLRLIRDDLSEAPHWETGEIVLNGPSLMAGYYRNHDAIRESFSKWGFHTGDYAYADEDGFLYIQGRRDDIFKSGGEKVSAKEIEDVLAEHPAVRDVAVVPKSDPHAGAVAVAYVVLNQDGSHVTERDILSSCVERLAGYKIPRQIHFVDELPKSSTGKIKKYKLREALS